MSPEVTRAGGFVLFPLQEEEGKDGGNHDSHSVSSEILDLLLLEDARSGTGSAESGLPLCRIEEEVLKEDLERLTAMEDGQPWFTEGQKEELAEVHPWIRTGTVPEEINTQVSLAGVPGPSPRP